MCHEITDAGIAKMAIAVEPGDAIVRNEMLSRAFLISIAVHLSAILVSGVVVHERHAPTQQLLRVSLIDLSRREPPPPLKVEAPHQRIKPPPPPESKLNPRTERAAPFKAPAVATEPTPPLPPVPTKEAPANPSPPSNIEPTAQIEGGGSDAGAGNFLGNGDIGVLFGPGTAGGGGGTASSGLGRGSGPPGLPAQTVLRTNREATPIKSARANYPPMALRTGLESDVTLTIEVDAQGSVTKAEITKSGGSGFDEEALKAVKQTRFEPAQRNGQSVTAEFTYIYRFRLKR